MSLAPSVNAHIPSASAAIGDLSRIRWSVETWPDGNNEREWQLGSGSAGKSGRLSLSFRLHERRTVAYVYTRLAVGLDGWRVVDNSILPHSGVCLLAKWTSWVDVRETDAEFEAGGGQDKGRA